MSLNLQPIVVTSQQLIRVPVARSLQPVVANTKEQTKAGFSKRMNGILDERADVPKTRGRRQWIAKRYSVSVETARKWLMGLDMPDGVNLARIAEDLEVSADWLRANVGSPYPNPDDPLFDELTRTWPSLRTEDRAEVVKYARFRQGSFPAGPTQPGKRSR